MKKITLIFLFIMLCIIGFDTTTSLAEYSQSKSEAVMEIDSGRLLYANNENERLPMASTTKIVTAITVIENISSDEIIEITDETVDVEGSSVYLKAGDKFTVKDLLYGLMLRSGNDCAESLAVAVSGNIPSFCELMQTTATNCGALDSSFKNPHGLPCDGHFTTAADLCKITAYALKNELFSEIVASKSYETVNLTNGEKVIWKNKNKLLAAMDCADGVKTGYTKEAGRCFVGSATKNGMRVVAAVLNSPQMFERCEELLSFAFRDFQMVKLVDSSRFDYVVPSDKKDVVYPIRINKDFCYPLCSEDKIKIDFELPQYLSGKVKNGQEVGKIKIYCSKQLIFSQNIYTLI